MAADKQTAAKTPATVDINAAVQAALQAREATKKKAGRDDGYKISYGLSDAQALQDSFKSAGIDPALIPKNVDLSFYGKLQSLAGGKLDPKGALAAATYYDDGRSKTNEERIPELVATGVAQGKTGTELWKPVEAWNDSQRGKKQGWGAVEDFATGFAHSVADNPLASAAISAAASAMGVPPTVVSGLLAANRAGKDGNIEGALKGMAMDYIGAKAGQFAGGAAKGALAGSGLNDTVSKGLTNVASGAAKQLATKGSVDLKGLATGAITGGVKDYAGDAISGFAKDQGWDSLNFDNFSIPGGIDLGKNLVPGISAGNARTIASLNPLGRKALALDSVVRNPTVNGINNLVNPAARPAPRGARPPLAAVKPPPTGTRPPIGGVKKPIPPGG